MIYDSVQDVVMDDVFLRLDRFLPHANLFLKIESLNPGGSIKLKTAVSLIEDAERKGLLRPGGTVIESSSGNLGVGLSMICAVKRYKFICVIDPNTAPQNKAYMQALGAEVVTVAQKDKAGGY